MQHVFVVGASEKPLMPCHPARARQLLRSGRAVVYRQQPFAIRLLDRVEGDTQPVAVKIDPGYKTTGVAVVVEGKTGKRAVWGAEIKHRGHIIKERLDSRRAVRRGRRTRKLRYRSPRFLNRRNKFNKVDRWLPPSLRSRIDNITTWTRRLCHWVPVTSLSLELNKFDTQLMENPEIRGVEYQRGELYGCEIWSYLLEKWERKCAYCGTQGIPLEMEHIVPRGRNGSNRVSNLTLACRKCNQEKGNRTAAEFGYPKVHVQAKQSLRVAAALTATRWATYEALQDFGLPVECGTGGRTMFNRTGQGYAKSHWVDAACVGKSGANVQIASSHIPLTIVAIGRGSRKMCRTDSHGFPIMHRARHRQNNGFRTGDFVTARPQRGRRAGRIYRSRAISNASTNSLALCIEKNFFVSHRFCSLLQRADGYEYQEKEMLNS